MITWFYQQYKPINQFFQPIPHSANNIKQLSRRKSKERHLVKERRTVLLTKVVWSLFQKVGCDLRVGSNKNTDPCGVCGGNGSSCQSRYSWSLESISACSKSCGGGEWLVTKFIRLKHLQLVHREVVHLHRRWEQWILMNFEPANRPTFLGTFAEINNGYLDRLISPCYRNVTLCIQIAVLLERWTLEEFPSSLFRQRTGEMHDSWRKSLNTCRRKLYFELYYVCCLCIT